MSMAAHCDGKDCDSWTYHPEEHSFITLEWEGDVLHFCTWDCVLRYAAQFPPTDEVALEPDDD